LGRLFTRVPAARDPENLHPGCTPGPDAPGSTLMQSQSARGVRSQAVLKDVEDAVQAPRWMPHVSDGSHSGGRWVPP
jgi:hypothetical protein